MLAIELPITSFSLLDSSQDASDIEIAPRFGVPQVRVAIILDRAHEIAQLRSVKFIGAVPHAKASEFHVDCLRLKVRVSRYRAAKGRSHANWRDSDAAAVGRHIP